MTFSILSVKDYVTGTCSYLKECDCTICCLSIFFKRHTRHFSLLLMTVQCLLVEERRE